MITALSLIPSIDRTLTVPKFTYGGLNRVSSEKQDAGGKGINVSLVLRALNCDVCCAGFLHREPARFLRKNCRPPARITILSFAPALPAQI